MLPAVLDVVYKGSLVEMHNIRCNNANFIAISQNTSAINLREKWCVLFTHDTRESHRIEEEEASSQKMITKREGFKMELFKKAQVVGFINFSKFVDLGFFSQGLQIFFHDLRSS